MAIVRAVKTGVWSDVTVWNTGALPGPGDDVYANNFTVTINTSTEVLSISTAATTGVTAGGTFIISANGITLTANVLGGNTVLTVTVGAGATVGLIGNIVSVTNSTNNSVSFSGSGTFNVTGNITVGFSGGSGNINVLSHSGSGVLNYNGVCTGSSVGGSANCINVFGIGTANINGTFIGGTNGNALVISGSGIINVTGTIQGSGTAFGGYGAVNSGILIHTGTVQASSIGPAIGPGSATQVTILTGPLLCSSPNDATAGVNPCIALRWFPADTALSTFRYEMRGATASGIPSVRPVRQLFLTDAYSSGYPASNNVNNGSTYGPGAIYTGTMNIPNSSAVSLGVPVGVTTGTMVLPTLQSIWNYSISDITTSGSIGERLKNSATVETVNTILSNGLR